MSGIVGILNFDGAPVDPGLLHRMTTAMARRGPDAESTWLGGAVGLGYTLLRTTDESANESQPLTLDGQVWIVADARVDARADLVRALEPFARDRLDAVPDVELILRAYLAWGE